MDFLGYIGPILQVSAIVDLVLTLLCKKLKRCRKVVRAARRLVAELPFKKSALAAPLEKSYL